MTKILQIDREAYARLEDYEPGSMGWRMITEPSGADCVGVAAFASHREQATVELYEALVDAVCLGDVRYVRRVRGQNDEHCDRIDKIKAAIANHNPLTKASPDA